MSHQPTPLTLADLPVGTKVKIPTRKSSGYTYDFFINRMRRLAPEVQYLTVTAVLPNGVQTNDPTDPTHHWAFLPEDLELYEEPLTTRFRANFGPTRQSESIVNMTNQSMKEYDEQQFAPIKRSLDALEDLLRYKHRKYGASGLKSGGTFSKQSTLEKLLARADDKVARIQNSDELRKGDVCDLAGYLLLIMAHKEWDNFEDQKD